MTDHASFKFGGTTFPLTASTANSLLKDVDPALYYLLDYFAAVIQIHLGSRIAAECLAGGITVSSSVANKIPLDPSPYLAESQYKFPLLAAYRENSVDSEHSTVLYHDSTEVGVQYILPPLSAGQAERLLPILRGVKAVLTNRTVQGFDPNYNSGALVWTLSGIEEIQVTKSSYGKYDFGGKLVFPTLRMGFVVKEINSLPAGDLEDLEGLDINLDLTDGTSTVSDVVQTSTEF